MKDSPGNSVIIHVLPALYFHCRPVDLFCFSMILNVIKAIRRYEVSPVSLISLCVIYMIIVDNNTFWSSLIHVINLSGMGMYLFLFACASFIFSVCFSFFAVFGVGWLLKPLIVIVLIIASITAYYMDAYGTIFNDVMVQNIFETNIHEATELFDEAIFFHVFIFGILPAIFISFVKVSSRKIFQAISIRLVAIIIVIAIAGLSIYSSYKNFSFIFRQNKEISFFVNPVFPLRAVYRYYEKQYHARNNHFEKVFNDAYRINQLDTSVVTTHKKNKNIFILVVGETARAHNFHLDGYSRQTTPELEKRKVINFSHVRSCGTATAVSVPCMFSDLNHANFDDNKARSRQNLLDALRIAGINVLWRENNPDCKGVCDRIKTDGYKDIYVDKLCHNGRCFDEALFHGLDAYIRNLKDDAVIVLHTQGSHGPAYYRRYPEAFKKFLPECRSSNVQNCKDKEVINAYDNTILYTDYFLAKIIDYLKENPVTKNSAMLYLSDHGESLGEKGVYLHGLPYFVAPVYQTHIPMVLWLSKGFLESKRLNENCMREKSNIHYSQDNILHSILGIMDVRAKRYNASLDIFASCRQK